MKHSAVGSTNYQSDDLKVIKYSNDDMFWNSLILCNCILPLREQGLRVLDRSDLGLCSKL